MAKIQCSGAIVIVVQTSGQVTGEKAAQDSFWTGFFPPQVNILDRKSIPMAFYSDVPLHQQLTRQAAIPSGEKSASSSKQNLFVSESHDGRPAPRVTVGTAASRSTAVARSMLPLSEILEYW